MQLPVMPCMMVLMIMRAQEKSFITLIIFCQYTFIFFSTAQTNENDGSWKSVFDRLRNVTDRDTRMAFYFAFVSMKNETELSIALEEAMDLPKTLQDELFMRVIKQRPESSLMLFRVFRKGFQEQKISKVIYDFIRGYIRHFSDGHEWDEDNKNEIGNFHYFCDLPCRTRWAAIISRMETWMI